MKTQICTVEDAVDGCNIFAWTQFFNCLSGQLTYPLKLVKAALVK